MVLQVDLIGPSQVDRTGPSQVALPGGPSQVAPPRWPSQVNLTGPSQVDLTCSQVGRAGMWVQACGGEAPDAGEATRHAQGTRTLRAEAAGGEPPREPPSDPTSLPREGGTASSPRSDGAPWRGDPLLLPPRPASPLRLLFHQILKVGPRIGRGREGTRGARWRAPQEEGKASG